MEGSNVEWTDTSTISMGSSPTLLSVTLISALQHFNHCSCTVSFHCDYVQRKKIVTMLHTIGITIYCVTTVTTLTEGRGVITMGEMKNA